MLQIFIFQCSRNLAEILSDEHVIGSGCEFFEKPTIVGILKFMT